MFKQCAYVPELSTPRLLLRYPIPSDAADLALWLHLSEVYTYFGRAVTKGEKHPELLFIDPRPHVKRKPSPDYIWGIVLKETGKMIGLLEIFEVENGRMGKVGYRIAPAFWGQGICTEALQEAIRFVFGKTSLNRLETSVHVDNIGSWRVLEKCGFLREGTVRQGKMGSLYCNYHLYGLLRQDLERPEEE